MNNISSDLNPKGGYTRAIRQDCCQCGSQECKSFYKDNNDGLRQSLDYIGMINRPQGMNSTYNPRTQKSVQEFLKNPELIEEKIAFQDELMASGYAPEIAMEKTEMFFKALKDCNTYKN